MQPLKPEEKARILDESPQAEPGDFEEYERLLAERFASDPDVQASSHPAEAPDANEARLAELHAKLFPERVPVS